MFDKAVRARAILVPFVFVALAGFTTVAGAQVGHAPNRSPYEDLKPTQDLSFAVGRLSSGTDPASVNPQSAIFYSLRYDVPIGGPAFLTARYSLMPSERNVLVPSNTADTRFLRTTNTTTHAADVGLTLALTGRKTYRRFVPALAGGIGIASNFAKPDTGGYKFGTKFAFTWGGNLRYVMQNGWSVRADATNYFWQYTYPDTYLVLSTDGTSVLKNSGQRTKWKGNWALSAGLSMPIFR